MAFVLVAFILLFGLILTFYVSIRLSSVKQDVNELRHEQAQALVNNLAGSPEFAWTLDDCASCIDLDKVFMLKNQSAAYRTLWGTTIVLLRVDRIYPISAQEVECTSATYPECTRITLLNQGTEYTTDESFVALCRLEAGKRICTLGTMIMGVASA